MKLKIEHFLLLLINNEIIKAFSIEEYLDNPSYYKNELCSYNGIPTLNPETNEVTCECNSRYINEPNEKKREYINGHMIQCSYRKKSRFKVVFFALCFPFGIDFYYLERYLAFSIVLCLSLLTIIVNIMSLILWHKNTLKNKEKIILKKMKISNKEKKGDKDQKISNIKQFSILSKLLLFSHLLYATLDIIAHLLGNVPDANKVETENDILYIFDKPNMGLKQK